MAGRSPYWNYQARLGKDETRLCLASQLESHILPYHHRHDSRYRQFNSLFACTTFVNRNLGQCFPPLLSLYPPPISTRTMPYPARSRPPVRGKFMTQKKNPTASNILFLSLIGNLSKVMARLALAGEEVPT